MMITVMTVAKLEEKDDNTDGHDDNVDISKIYITLLYIYRTLAFLIAFCWAALSVPSSLPPTTMSIMQPFNTCWRNSGSLQDNQGAVLNGWYITFVKDKVSKKMYFFHRIRQA